MDENVYIPLIIMALIIVAFAGADRSAEAVFTFTRLAFAPLRLVWWLVREAHWHLWKKPRLSEAMWKHEVAARAHWGNWFQARGPLPDHVRAKFAPERAAPAPQRPLRAAPARPNRAERRHSYPHVVDVEWETVSSRHGARRR